MAGEAPDFIAMVNAQLELQARYDALLEEAAGCREAFTHYPALLGRILSDMAQADATTGSGT